MLISPLGVKDSPLYSAIYCEHLKVIKHWIASGREMKLSTIEESVLAGMVRRHEKELAKLKVDFVIEHIPDMFNMTEAEYYETMIDESLKAAVLVKSFRSQPERIRHEVRIELKLYDELAAEVFALVIFVCDGLLKIKEDVVPKIMAAVAAVAATATAARFFNISSQLPIELQMMLCHRVVGSMKNNIRVNPTTEIAFRNLVEYL